jgi:hypothetical protein
MTRIQAAPRHIVCTHHVSSILGLERLECGYVVALSDRVAAQMRAKWSNIGHTKVDQQPQCGLL